MNLAIDVGNSRVKAAVFLDDKLIELFVFQSTKIISEIKNIKNKFDISDAIISNVAAISDVKFLKIQHIVPITKVSSTIHTPFFNKYKTPNTLGADRIALVAAAVKNFPQQNVLVIDAGTCITFDFVDENANYFGGAISPGIEMRFKSLHFYTSKLPLLEKSTLDNFIGQNTQESINSGVVNGVIQEIDGVIEQYKRKYQHLTIVLTGGDTNFLSKQLKSSIFANQNFLLEGLNELLIFNKNK
ncbi:type III pantothenate kinase [Polaribacter gangjinensis]|uniref:Type III pantothenate kinase n=1 Tax=Polaribacter gangjinensis TaxID=574710 RepID=A0A2S7WEF1_9FLAO|nr:type III pantothenate kinase [Polaribacter gangjinensis]PQJ75990.1 pantothenate kinase [Polaribacter gangjinensis]